MIVRSVLAGLSVAGLLATAAPAFAAENGSAPTPAVAKLDLRKGDTVAMLAKPRTKDVAIDGRMWHCDGGTCRAASMASERGQPIGRECSAAAHSIGAFTSYQTGDEVLGADALAKCNKDAR